MDRPKIIHYVWLGSGKMSPFIQDCVDSWKRVMPDYEIKCWNEQNFDVNSVVWVKEALENKKWSLASDYIRHYALYTEGGIYMDTDVKVYKPFDEFLKYDFFSSIELHPNLFKQYGCKQVGSNGELLEANKVVEGMGILAALIAAKPNNEFIKECLDYFGNRHFVNPDGSLYTDIINPGIMATLAVKYGFRYIDKTQVLDNNMIILDSSVFAGNAATFSKQSYSMHYCDGSWREKTLVQKLKSFIRNYFLVK